MSTLNFKPLSIMFNAAVHTICKAVLPGGFDVGPDAPSTLEALMDEWERRGRFTVWDGACDNTIFDDPQTNQMFRAWHDWCHIQGRFDFTLQGEQAAAHMQCEHIAARYGTGETGQELMALVMMEVVGQKLYADAHGGEFPTDQKAFAKAYLTDGPDAAINATF